MTEEKSFGHLIKQWRSQRDFTQEALAERTGCATQTIRTFESGRRRPSRELAERLAAVLDVPADQLPAFLRSARRPVSLPGVDVASLESPPPPRSGRAVPRTGQRQLPVPATPLIGREAELKHLAAQFADRDCRLLTLVGPGGIGKTRLALQAAAMLAPRFADGVAWTELAPLDTPDQVVTALGEAVGCAFQGMEPPSEQLQAFLREREQLIVLDNLEHLLDATGLISALLSGAPALRLLVTSRERLRIQGEWVVELEGLAVSPQRAGGSEPAEAVLLFLERARRADRHFTLHREEEATVGHICRLVDGMPLGIELAAAWISVLTIEEIAAEIERGLDFLKLAMRDAPERHSSLRAVFDHSWHLLADDQRGLLRRLAVFRGGFTRDAAAAVAGASLPLLASLVDKSLLRRTGGSVTTQRYDLHPLVRQYAAAHLAADAMDEGSSYERHCHYYAALCEQREQRLKGAAQHDAVTELSREIGNIRAAWEWAIAQDRLQIIEPAFETLHWLYEFRTWFADGETLFRRALERPADPAAPFNQEEQRLTGRLLMHHGYFASRRGELAVARDELRTAIGHLRTVGAETVLLGALIYQGIVGFQMGELELAGHAVEESFERATRIDDRWNIALSSTWQGILAQARGDFELARQRFRTSLAVWRDVGNPRGTLVCLTFWSITLYIVGEYEQAEAMLRESLALSTATDDHWGMGTAFNHLGLLAMGRRDYAEARYLFRESLTVFREGGNRWDIVRALNNLADATGAMGDTPGATALYREALRTAIAAQALPDALQAIYGLAAVRVSHDPPAALQLLYVIDGHPAADHAIRDRAAQLRAELAAQLGGDELTAVEAAARAKPFAVVVADLIDAEQVV